VRLSTGTIVAAASPCAASSWWIAGEPGIACLLRRTYKGQELPAGAGDYDFVNYFECSDADVSVLESVCAALRDVSGNPEWKYVREGPTWHGRRTGTWQELFT